MTSSLLAPVLLVLLTTSGPPGFGTGADRADDRAVSVGLWNVVAVETNGKQVDPELVALLQVAYRADGSWSVLFKGLQLAEGTSTNDQAAHPKTFEMETLASERSTPQKYTGIYRLEDDTRQLCFVEAGLPRPDTFAAPRGSRRVLVTLRRAKAMLAPRGAEKATRMPLRRRHATAAWTADMIWQIPQRTFAQQTSSGASPDERRRVRDQGL